MRFTEDYLTYAKEFTDCPPIFLHWGALLAISSVLTREVYYPAGSWNIAPHIWPVLIGRSSSHKSTALSITEDLIESLNPERLAPHEFSQEAILKALSERPAQLFIFDEAKSFFDSMGKKYNDGLKSLFTTLYRKSHYTRTTLKYGTLSIKGAYMTIGMASTPEWLRASLTDAEDASLSGFLARFLLVPFAGVSATPMSRPPAHDMAKFGLLKDRLRQMSYISRAFTYDHEAGLEFDRWFVQLTARENDAHVILGPFFEHFKNEAIHKLGILFAIDRCENSITVDAFREAALALSYLEKMLPTLIEDITNDKWQRERTKIIAILKKNESVDRSKLSRLSHLTGQHLQKHIDGLKMDRLIELNEQPTKGRSMQMLIWVGDE